MAKIPNTMLRDAAPDAASNAAAAALLGAHDAVGTMVKTEEAAEVRHQAAEVRHQSSPDGYQELWKATP